MLKSLFFALVSLIFSANSFAEGWVNPPQYLCNGGSVRQGTPCNTNTIPALGQTGFVVTTPVAAVQTVLIAPPVGRVIIHEGRRCTAERRAGLQIGSTIEGAVIGNLAGAAFKLLTGSGDGTRTAFTILGGLSGWSNSGDHVLICQNTVAQQGVSGGVTTTGGQTTTTPSVCRVDGVEVARGLTDKECLELGKPRVVQTGGQKITAAHPAGCEVRIPGVGRKVTDWPGSPETCNRQWTMAEFNAITTPLLPE
jgi:hypothetical protein